MRRSNSGYVPRSSDASADEWRLAAQSISAVEALVRTLVARTGDPAMRELADALSQLASTSQRWADR